MPRPSSQLERFREAVERRIRRARSRAEGRQAEPPIEDDRRGDEPDLYDPGRPPDTLSPREKSTGHGKKTADKWNQ